MKMPRSYVFRSVALVLLMASLTVLSTKTKADAGSCGGVTITVPFTDVAGNGFFCQIAAAYFSGLTNGTSATTYDPAQPVTREQMAAFITRTMDQSLKRGSERAVTKKWFTPQSAASMALTNVGSGPVSVKFDGTDLWVSNFGSGSVMRVRASDGKLLDTWTGASNSNGLLAAMGRIFAVAPTDPGTLYMIDPTQPAGVVTTVTSALGAGSLNLAFDGTRIWTTNYASNSVSMVTLNPTSVTTITTGFPGPVGVLYDGASIWVTTSNAILKLNADGTIAQTIPLSYNAALPVFDGTNIWVPLQGTNSLAVVRVKDAMGNPLASAFVLTTLNGNGLNGPNTATFDGERILVTNNNGDSISLWKAADLTPLGNFATGTGTVPTGACSDGLNFWITFQFTGKLARF